MAKDKIKQAEMPEMPATIPPDMDLMPAEFTPAERQAMQARIDALEAELAAKNQPLAAEVPALAPVAMSRFLVRVKDAPSWVVEAPSIHEAFAAYCKAVGVVSTPHKPEVNEAGDLPLGRHRD